MNFKAHAVARFNAGRTDPPLTLFGLSSGRKPRHRFHHNSAVQISSPGGYRSAKGSHVLCDADERRALITEQVSALAGEPRRLRWPMISSMR